MFNGISFKTFLSTPEEWHAFVIGFFESFCPWKPRLLICASSREELKGEYHYYMAGRALGFVALLLVLTLIAKLIKEVLL